MKLKDLEDAIKGLKDTFGDKVSEQEIYMDFTFDNEIIVEVGNFCITTLCIIPQENKEN